MGLINKIRQRTGIAVGVVAVGLIFFLVGGDLLSSSSVLMSGTSQSVGSIAGEDISLERYRQVLEQVTQNYTANTGRSPDASNVSFIQSQAWEYLVTQIVHSQEYSKLGLETHPAEVVDMVQGDHIRPDIKQAFEDPDTKEFDKSRLREYLQNIPSSPPADQLRWYTYENNISTERSLQKYNNLLTKSNYVTQAEARWAFQNSERNIDVRYVYIPYGSLFDSLYSPSEAELEDYLDENAYQYQVKRNRSIDYINFPLVPSLADSSNTRADIASLREAFAQAVNDSIFASINSEASNAYQVFTPDKLPKNLQGDSLYVGLVAGPYLDKAGYSLYKVSAELAGANEQVRARHILIKVAEDATETVRSSAKRKIDGLLRDLKQGADFETLARENSMDGSAAQGGDLGWFGRGKMVAPFEEAAFGATQIGLIPRVIKTQFGYHLIDVTELSTTQEYAISTIVRSIEAGDNTRNQIYDTINTFLQAVRDSDFTEQASLQNLLIEQADNTAPDAYRISGLGNARAVVQWAYQADQGDVSNIFELDDQFVVAQLRHIQNQGTQALDAIRETITEKVITHKKGNFILATLDTIDYQSLDELQATYGKNAFVYANNNLRLNSTTLRNAGDATEAIGLLFTLPLGIHPQPLRTETGIILAEITAINPSKDIQESDYDRFERQLVGKRGNPGLVQNAVKFFSDIVDDRYKFF